MIDHELYGVLEIMQELRVSENLRVCFRDCDGNLQKYSYEQLQQEMGHLHLVAVEVREWSTYTSDGSVWETGACFLKFSVLNPNEILVMCHTPHRSRVTQARLHLSTLKFQVGNAVLNVGSVPELFVAAVLYFNYYYFSLEVA